MIQQVNHAVQPSRIFLRSPDEPATRYEGRVGQSDGDGLLEQHQGQLHIPLDELVFIVVASFRGHGHLNNVLTHISGGKWDQVEQALRVILDPCTGSHELSPLARNIVDLMCADRGVTGRILKPFYRGLLITVLGETVASHLIAHVTSLFLERERAAQPGAINPLSSSAPANSGVPH